MRRQQIIETVTCDKCGTDTDEPASWTIEMVRPRSPGQPIRRTVDMCPTCAPLVADLHDLLRRIGRPATPTTDQNARTSEVEDCPVCGETKPVMYMSAHLGKKHRATAPQPPRCPDCDVPPHKDASALIVHRRKAHGYDHRAAMLASIAPSPKRKPSR